MTVIWRKDGTPVIQYAQERRVKPSELSDGFHRKEGEKPPPVRMPAANGLVAVQEMVESPLDGKAVRVYGVDGKEIDPKDVSARIKEPTPALLSMDGKPVDPFYLRLAKEGTLVLVGPRAVDATAAQAARPPMSLILDGGPPKAAVSDCRCRAVRACRVLLLGAIGDAEYPRACGREL